MIPQSILSEKYYMETEQERSRVIEEAKTWLQTPFHHEARVKGCGVDCAQLLIGVYGNAGVIPDYKSEHYSHQWHLHRDRERYIEEIMKFAREIEGPPRTADVVLWKVGRVFSHAIIVVRWPDIGIHAACPRAVEFCDPSRDAFFIGREKKFFSAWGK